MSTLARSYSRCPNILPATEVSIWSSLPLGFGIEGGSTVIRAYVPGPRLFETVPGLIVTTDSMTLKSGTISLLKEKKKTMKETRGICISKTKEKKKNQQVCTLQKKDLKFSTWISRIYVVIIINNDVMAEGGFFIYYFFKKRRHTLVNGVRTDGKMRISGRTLSQSPSLR